MLILIPTAYEAGVLFGDGLREELLDSGSADYDWLGCRTRVVVCGFGLAAAGAGAAWGMSDATRAVLIGLAGTLDPKSAPVGSALFATAARSVGIGVGEGPGHLGAEEMGWMQGHSARGLAPVGDRVPFLVPELAGEPVRCGGLISVAAASASPAEADARAARYPDALAEEMEAFAVGLAARLRGVPLTVIRGISNVAGDRRFADWRVAEALAAAKDLLARMLTLEEHDDETRP